MNLSDPLEAIIISGELDRRFERPPELLGENRALGALIRALNDSNADVLQEVAEAALRLCQADSAGISIAEEHDGREVFRWRAAAGRWSEYLGYTLPRHASPCGIVIDRNEALLMHYPERHFTYPFPETPRVVETLLVPFALAGRTVGTVWAVQHGESRKFDREDLRLLRSLSEFASVAYQVVEQQRQIHEALDRELAGSQVLRSISGGLIHETDIGALYEQILDAAAAIMRSQFASLQIVGRDGALQLLAWRGFHAQSAQHWKTVRLGSQTSCGQALGARERVVIGDIETCADIAGTEDLTEFRRSGIRSVQSTPLISREGQLIGMVSTHWSQPHIPSDGEVRIFDILARQTADLLEHANTEAALREVDRRKNEFLAVLGHELRNPLAPLSTGIELLQRAGHRPELVESVHSMMKRQVSHLARLVDDLLDLSRITRGQTELRRAAIDLRVVIEAAVELARPLIDQYGHRLIVEHGAEPMPLDGDLDRLTQVVGNLLTNAAKYMEPGGTIVLRSTIEDAQAIVRVRDAGFGIPRERLEDVFEMFSQVPEHRLRRGGGGLGIGLALSRQLIELHGGSLSAASEGLDCGSEFVMRLPLGATAEIAERDPEANSDAATVHRRVLVVDDNVDAAVSLRAALELAGHAVAVAHDGSDSLGLLETFDPEVVLLDIGLPRMDGYQLAKRIRSLPGGETRVLVAITGWGQQSDRDRAWEAGFDQHLTKPVTLEAVERLLVRAPPTERC